MRYTDLLMEAATSTEAEWKAIATDDYQNRDGRYPKSGVPDDIRINTWGDEISATFTFKNTSEVTGKAWVKRFLDGRGLAYGRISSNQDGDYRDDWVKVNVACKIAKPKAKPASVVAPVSQPKAAPQPTAAKPVNKPIEPQSPAKAANEKSVTVRAVNGVLKDTPYRLKTGDATNTKVMVFTAGKYTGKLEAKMFGAWLKDKGVDGSLITQVNTAIAAIK